MINVSFKLIAIDNFKTLLLPLNIILIFLPLLLYEQISFIHDNYFWGIWVVVLIFLFYFQINFIQRYKTIGDIYIDSSLIEIRYEDAEHLRFLSSENLNVFVEYKGYKSESIKYVNPLFMPFRSKDGVGRLEIERNGIKFKYHFLAERNFEKQLVEVLNNLEQRGNIIDLRKE